jgi:biotin carboxyl carrier protein
MKIGCAGAHERIYQCVPKDGRCTCHGAYRRTRTMAGASNSRRTVAGKVSNVIVNVGDSVKGGQVLVEFE